MSRHGHATTKQNGQAAHANEAVMTTTPAAELVDAAKTAIDDIETSAKTKVAAAEGFLDQLAKRVVEQPFRSVGVALLAGAFLGYESPRRGIMMGALRMFVLSELRSFVDGMPAKYGELLRNPLQTPRATA